MCNYISITAIKRLVTKSKIHGRYFDIFDNVPKWNKARFLTFDQINQARSITLNDHIHHITM